MLERLFGVAGISFLAGCEQVLLDNTQMKAKRFKIGACDWSLGKRANPASFEIANKLGLDGVQISLGTLKDGMVLRDRDTQKLFLEQAEKYKMEVASIGIGILNAVPYKSDPRAEQWVSDGIDVCRAMNIKVMLLAFFSKGDLKNDKKGTDVVVERLKKVATKAERAGVSLGIESLLSADEHMDIINRVGSPAVKVYYDVSNSHEMGYDIYNEIRQLGRENICEFHAKDYNNLFGQGKIDFVKVRHAMDDIDYHGWINLERSMPLGLMPSYRHNVKYLRSIFSPDA